MNMTRDTTLTVLAACSVVAVCGCGRIDQGLARLRADAYRHRGRYEDAIEVYQRIPTNHQPLAVLEGLAECYAELGAFTNAVAVYARIYSRSGSEGDLLRLVWTQLDMDQHTAALTSLRDLVQRQPGDLGYRELLISTLLRSSESNDVPRELRRMEEDLPGTATNLAVLASWWLTTGDSSNAIRLLERAIEAGPEHHAWRMAFVNALVENRQFDAAMSNLEILVALQPENADVHQVVGYALAEMGRTDDAIAALRLAIKLDQDNVLALNNLAYTLLLEDRNIREAYELAQSAVQADRASYTVDTLAYACYKRGSYDAALRYLKEAERLLRKEGRGYDAELDFHYGLVLAEQGQLDEAMPRFQRALKAMPELERSLRRERYYPVLKPHLTTNHE
jgi:tetratricopeptide (TPR) repeat protein